MPRLGKYPLHERGDVLKLTFFCYIYFLILTRCGGKNGETMADLKKCWSRIEKKQNPKLLLSKIFLEFSWLLTNLEKFDIKNFPLRNFQGLSSFLGQIRKR